MAMDCLNRVSRQSVLGKVYFEVGSWSACHPYSCELVSGRVERDWGAWIGRMCFSRSIRSCSWLVYSAAARPGWSSIPAPGGFIACFALTYCRWPGLCTPAMRASGGRFSVSSPSVTWCCSCPGSMCTGTRLLYALYIGPSDHLSALLALPLKRSYGGCGMPCIVFSPAGGVDGASAKERAVAVCTSRTTAGAVPTETSPQETTFFPFVGDIEVLSLPTVAAKAFEMPCRDC
mmetsp:Transcript_6274/g.21040  ORF Transcript_6274/g.21040 Transcript_6274/m.21040 type:complete len:232 (-) Transcript_6274:217-912(-)